MSVQRPLRMIVAVALSLATARAFPADEQPARSQSSIPASAGRRQSPGGRAGAYEIREVVDPRDARERFAILLPGGPLIVEATLTIDGEPFRTRREALIDDMLAAGDVDGDGSITWQEALPSLQFTHGRVLTEPLREQYVRMLDWDDDGAISRWEARGFIAAMSQGPAFVVTSGFTENARLLVLEGQFGGHSDVMALLDTDGDGVLSRTEVAAAGERLSDRDADGNELLYLNEIGDANSNYRSGRERYAAQQHAILLEPAPPTLFGVVQDKYQAEGGVVAPGSFWGVPDLFDQLDADGNRILSESEIVRINEVEPQLRMTVDLGSGPDESSLALTYLAGGRRRPDDAPDSAIVDLPGVTLTLRAETPLNVTENYETTARQLFQDYDSDGNEYLEESELPAGRRQQFPVWDLDTDGKVLLEEIVESYALQQAPEQTQIQAGVRRAGDPLLAVLDLSGDSRLSLREMKTAPVQLASLDADGDGEITRREIPVSFVVDFHIGNRAFTYNRPRADPVREPPHAPPWFVRMDRNGDGDVTLREFPGDRDTFRDLDANSDGFLEPAEANAATSPP